MTKSSSKKPKKFNKGINQFMDLEDQEFSRFYLNPYLNVRFYSKGKYAQSGTTQTRYPGRFL